MDCLGYDPYEWYGYGLYGLYTDIGDCDCGPRLREMLVPTSETETVRVWEKRGVATDQKKPVEP